MAQITTKARGYNTQTHRGDQKTVTDTQGRHHEPRGNPTITLAID